MALQHLSPGEDVFISVRADGDVKSKHKVSIREFEEIGFTIKDSCSGKTDKDLFYQGKMVAGLFKTETKAMKYIETLGTTDDRVN